MTGVGPPSLFVRVGHVQQWLAVACSHFLFASFCCGSLGQLVLHQTQASISQQLSHMSVCHTLLLLAVSKSSLTNHLPTSGGQSGKAGGP